MWIWAWKINRQTKLHVTYNKHEVLTLRSIWRAFENILYSYFSCQQGSEALILHFYLYPFLMEFLRALLLLVCSPCLLLLSSWHVPLNWTIFYYWLNRIWQIFFFLDSEQRTGSGVCSLVHRLPKPHISSITFPHFGLCHTVQLTRITNLLRNH